MVVVSQRHLGIFGRPVVARDGPGDDSGLSGSLPGRIVRRFWSQCYAVGVLSLSTFCPKFGSEGDLPWVSPPSCLAHKLKGRRSPRAF